MRGPGAALPITSPGCAQSSTLDSIVQSEPVAQFKTTYVSRALMEIHNQSE